MNEQRPYRGWTKEGKWVYGWYFRVHGNRHFIAPEEDLWFVETDEYNRIITPTELDGFVEVIPETIGQSTGRRDKGGKEIYVGDIVHSKWVDIEYQDGEEEITEVTFEKGVFRLTCSLDGYDTKWLEVIGNIHENKDLIEEDKNALR